MKPIELTQEQKDKLLEMCKVLFPEWTLYEIQPANHFGRVVNIVEGNKWKHDEEDNEDYAVDEFFIHWFEFCMTYLQQKLYNELSKSLSIGIDSWNYNLMGKVYFHCFVGNGIVGHPIDYLYEEFKKLK